jgi:cell division protease FtsH
MFSDPSEAQKRQRRAVSLVLAGGGVLALAAILLFTWRSSASTAPRAVSYTELAQIAATGALASVRIDGERFLVETDAGRITAVVDDAEARHRLVESLVARRVPVEFRPRASEARARVLEMLVPTLAICLIAGVWIVRHRRSQRAHFSFAARDGGRKPVGFAEVAGMDEVKESLAETVEFLRNPARFGRLGGRAPRGVLLTGDPGTGKTLLARAVAHESRVPFLSVSGSSFQEKYVGVGAARVRKLFAEARKVAPCIIFIDEIDAVGRSRARNGESATAEHDQTLNQLLVEMDGFDHRSGIVVIAATNRADVLDSAMLRPGRFDRQITVPLPDLRGRLEILRVHAAPLELAETVDLSSLARGTPGFSGAELANLLNEAAILAVRDEAEVVGGEHIERARDRILMGVERKGVLMDQEERHATAVHEAGHVAIGIVAPHTDPVHKVSILPRGRALGVTQSLPERDRVMYRKEYLEDQICLLLGGRAAELEILGTMTAGAADDIERASHLARRMVAELGMSELGAICLKDSQGQRGEQLLDRVEETTRQLLETQLERARGIVRGHRFAIARLVDQLLEHETLGAEAIRDCFQAAPLRLEA